MSDRSAVRRRFDAGQGTVGLVVGSVLGLVALGPLLLHRGFTLSYDMVFVPTPPITDAVLGVDGSVPRAVPNDLVVALLSRVLPGDIVQKALLMAVFIVGAWGVARLASNRLAALVAAVLFVWNPYVYQRLVIGHWGYLLGYALLPWVAAAGLAARGGGRKAVACLCLTVALSGLTGSTSLILSTVLALAVVAVPGAPRRAMAAGWVLATSLGSAAAWLVPVLTRDEAIPADPHGVTAFAAGADTPLGVVPSVVSLGGIWNEAVWPPERRSLLVACAGLAFVTAALVVGGRRLARAWNGAGVGLLVAGGAGLVLAVAGAVPGLEAVLRQLVLHLPGGGLLRDGQKFAALLALPVALCAGLMAEAARGWLDRAAVLLAIAPVVLLPSLAWGAAARLEPVRYPEEWAQVRTVVARHGGDVAVFPFHYYRRFAWNGDRVLLDPIPRFLPGHVVVNDDLPLSGSTVRGEDPQAARIRAAVEGGADDLPSVLRREGISLAVVHRGEADPHGTARRLEGLDVLFDGKELRVLEVSALSRREDVPLPWGLVVAGLTLLVVIGVRWLPGRRSAARLEVRGRPT